MKTLYLQILPFIVCLFAGILIFFIEENILVNEGLSSLAMGIASGLIGIPLIFICYEIFKDFSQRRIRSAITNHLIFEINYVIIKLLKDLKKALNFKEEFTKDTLYRFLIENKDLKNRKLSFTLEQSKNFQKYKQKILKIVYSIDKLDLFPDDVIQNILSITKELGIISLEIGSRYKDSALVIQNSLENLIDNLDEWIEFCELDAIINHHSLTLLPK